MYLRPVPQPEDRASFDLDAFLAMPRFSGLAISPDGRRLVTSVAAVGPDKKKFVTSLWGIDPSGERPARRLTWSPEGETLAGFRPDGSLLFTSTRKDPSAEGGGAKDDARKPALWSLPPDGGEASLLTDPSGGI